MEEPAQATTTVNGSCSSSTCTSSTSNGGSSSGVFASLFASSTASASLQSAQTPALTDLIRVMSHPNRLADFRGPLSSEPISLCPSNQGSSIFGTVEQERRQYAPPPQPAMSATALLQKAAQMGAAASGSLLCGLGIVSSSSSAGQQENLQWDQRQVEPESSSVPAGLGLGLPCDGGSGIKELMMGTPSMFGPKQTTLDFLGTCIGGGLDVTAATAAAFR